MIVLQQLAGNNAVTTLLSGRRTGGGPPWSSVVQRAPTQLQDFVQQWMTDHTSLNNQAFKDLAALPDDQRTAVLAEIRRRYGDEYIRRGQAGQLPNGLQLGPPAAEQVDATAYWAENAEAHLDSALSQVMTSIDYTIAGPGLHFDPTHCSAFSHLTLVGPLQRRSMDSISQLLGTPLRALINNARIIDDLDKGAITYEPAITAHIAERLGSGLRHATAKLGTPYALARAKAVADARAALTPARTGPLLAPDPDTVAAAQPAVGTFGATTTIEFAVAEALTTSLLVTFDEAEVGMLYVPQASPEPRPAVLELERGSGDWKSVQVTSPTDPRPVDVANALFGTPDLAHLVVGRGQRYTFGFPPSGRLAEPYDEWWHEHIEQDEGGGALDLIRGRAPSDPISGLDSGDAELRALDTAGQVTAEGDQAEVIQRLSIIHDHLLAIDTAAASLGVDGLVTPAVTRISARLQACIADPAEAQRWSAHTAAQINLISEARSGFDAITQQLLASGAPGQSTENGEELVGDVTEAMQGPTVELTQAYAAVIAASDQLDLAGTRLTVAKERLGLYPFDMADRLLATIRARIAVTGDHATVAFQSYSRARLDALQTEITAEVAELRMAVVNGDGTAVTRLADLKTKMAMLDLQTTVGSTLSVIQDLKGTLFASESMAPDTDRERDVYNALNAAFLPWRDLGAEYDQLWRSGDDSDEAKIADIRNRVEQLRKTTPLPQLIEQVTSFQTDEAKRQRWIAIGVMIAAALAAAVTGGLASGAIGGFAGAVVGAGMEALTFTAITSTLNTDQTFGGFMAELAINWATFGGLRGISKGSQILAGGKLTIAQRLAELSVEGLWMVAATKANEEIQAAIRRGEKMTTQSAASIFGHQMLISLASRIVARGATKILNGRADHLPDMQRFLAQQQEATNLAQQFLSKGDDAAGAAIVRAETATMKAEVTARRQIHEIASDPVKAKQHNLELTVAELATFTTATRAVARELTEREIALLMDKTKSYGSHVAAEPAVYTDLLKHHRDLGSRIGESLDAGGSPQAKIAPQNADGTLGTPFTLHSRLDREVQRILRFKGLTSTTGVHDYLAVRSGDRAAALADLRKVGSAAELDALIDKTLGYTPAPVHGPRPPRSAEDRAARQARVEAHQAATAEQNRLARQLHPDWPVVNGKPIRPWRATSTEYRWKYNDGNFIDAGLDADGALSVAVIAHGPRRAGAAKLLDAVFSHFGPSKIKRFDALWVGGGEFADNYNRYMKNLAAGQTREQAALNTWTGEQMIRLELPHVVVPPHAADATKITAFFSR